MTKKIILIVCLVLLSASCDKQNQPANIIPSPTYNYNHKLFVGSQTLMVEISRTPAQMEQGLSDRAAMDDNQGMLFDFGQTPSGTAFWMKGMKFNLDFIWIKNNRIIFITPNAQAPKSPKEHLELYSPPEPVTWVLEVNAGWAEKNKIKTGDEVRLK